MALRNRDAARSLSWPGHLRQGVRESRECRGVSGTMAPITSIPVIIPRGPARVTVGFHPLLSVARSLSRAGLNRAVTDHARARRSLRATFNALI